MASDLLRALEALDAAPLWEWQDEAPELIHRGLASDAAAERLIAVGLTAELMDDEVTLDVLKMLTDDPDEEVASRAAVSLGPALETCDVEGFDFFPDDLALSEPVFNQVISKLEAIYRDATVPKLVRRRALEAAVRAPRDWQVAVIRAALHADDVDWQVTAVFCMGYVEGFDEEIRLAFDRDEPRVRLEAVRAAGRQEVEAAGAAILAFAAAGDTERELRLAAIEALSSLSPEGCDDLLAELVGDRDGDVADTAEATLEERELFAGPIADEVGDDLDGELGDEDGYDEDDFDDFDEDEDEDGDDGDAER